MIKLITNQTSIESKYPISTLEECIEYLQQKTIIGLDIETTRKFNKYLEIEGLDPYTSDIVMLQIGDIETQFIIDTRNVDITKLLPILTNPDITIVGHNLKFEYKHILHKYGIRLTNLYDTMIAEKILFNGLLFDFSLKHLNKRYLGIDVDKSIRLSFLTINDRPFTTNEIEYGANDIIHPLQIRELQLLDTEKKELKNAIALEFRFIRVLGEMEYTGISFNTAIWLETYGANKIKYTQILEQLNTYVLTNYGHTKFVNKQYDLFSVGFNCNIQWSSSKQVIEFFKFLNCCPQAISKTTKKLSYTVEAKEVEALLVNSDVSKATKEFIQLYLKAKEAEQSVTTFGISFLKYVNPITKRVHSNYNQIVNTGRMSSRGPNNQNIPAKYEFRSAFDAPEGKVIINADYSGQENIVLANKAMDIDILKFYDEGLGDMHCFIASRLFPLECTFEELQIALTKKNNKEVLTPRDLELLNFRQIAKSAGFALAYGGDGHTISKNLGISKERGNAVYTDYFKAFPGLHSFFTKSKQTALKLGYILIDPITKRKFYFKDFKRLKALEYQGDYFEASKLRSQMERRAMNYIIQGESGSITKYAAILVLDWIFENNLQDHIKTVLIVHDEINLEVTAGYADRAAAMLENCMEKAGKLWCTRVPLKATAVQSNYWTH